jgi:hypothetical protein
MKITEILSEDDKEFRRKLLINLESLENDARLLPVQLFDINYLYAQSYVAHNEAVKDLKRVENNLYISVKKHLDSIKSKASEKAIEAKIQSNSLYIRALEILNKKKEELEFIKAKKEAIEVKLKMIQLAHEITSNKMYVKRLTKTTEEK